MVMIRQGRRRRGVVGGNPNLSTNQFRVVGQRVGLLGGVLVEQLVVMLAQQLEHPGRLVLVVGMQLVALVVGRNPYPYPYHNHPSSLGLENLAYRRYNHPSLVQRTQRLVVGLGIGLGLVVGLGIDLVIVGHRTSHPSYHIGHWCMRYQQQR